MTEVNPCGWLQNAGSTHTAEQLRSYLGSLFAVSSASSSLKAANGVHPGMGGQLAVTQNSTPNMSVNVAAGMAFITGTEGSKQGTYFVENDATVNKAIAASDPTNPRIDLVVAKVQDAFYSGGTNAWAIAVVTGTPAGSPSAPAAPNNSIILAQIAVAANATTVVTANITDKRPYNAALGGMVPTLSTARPSPVYPSLAAFELDTLRPIYNDGSNWRQYGKNLCTSSTRPANPWQGMEIYETDTSFNYQWNGSKWIRQRYDIVVTTDAQWTSTTTATSVSGGGGATTPSGNFSVSVEANSRYLWELELQVIGQVAVGLAVTLNQPTGCRTDDHVYGWAALSGGTWSATYNQNVTATAVVHATFQNGSARLCGTTLVGSTAGSLSFTFAQGVSNASTSWLLIGSTFSHKQVS